MLANVPRPGCDFGGVGRYLLNGHIGAKTNAHRVQWTKTRNLVTDDPMLALKIMTATAAQSARVERPAYHGIISWSEAEAPTREQMEEVVETTLADLGLDNHQALIVAHGDTTNPHLHMLINRVDADTGTAWSTKNDYRRFEQSIFRQAQAMGFKAVPGRHNGSGAKRELTRVRSRGAMMAARQGRDVKPWDRHQVAAIAPKLKHMLTEATTWQDAQAQLAAFGATIEAKGQGLVIRDQRHTGYVKLSALGTKVRLKDLEQRFGETFGAFAAQRDAQSRCAPQSVFTVTEMDIALGLYRMGLAGREAVVQAAANRQAKLDEAPLHTREMRALRAAIKTAVSPEPVPERNRPPRAPEPEPEPQR